MTRWDHSRSIKELVRHVALKVGASDFLDRRRKRMGLSTEHLLPMSPRQRFEAIYRTGAWKQAEGQQSASGTGSELQATQAVRAKLAETLRELGCRTFLDVGCGDLNWMRTLDLPCDYIGVDIVEELIQKNKELEKPGISFHALDAVKDPLPPSDIAFCREIIFHLSFRDIFDLIRNIKNSSDWLIATSDTSIWFNSDIRTGDFRMINLQGRPFNFPPPAMYIPDDDRVAGRILGVWRAGDL